ncbi:siderophore-interacting protein [Hoeflea sp. EC-HK425]|uniref:siderophore-interacting protein n=1 Tax=Hoeflea sp. EC-HK425 TaxID=2038388 RepID=UPI001258459A|nr:siderophore-interacting protein [Hoeflea sp. EC-HK425]VVS97971.1 Side tail fiber protein [Hoeflea sp. EC-HK425]
MNRALPLAARARVLLRDPQAVLSKVAVHLVEHGARIGEGQGGMTLIDFEFCRGTLHAERDSLVLQAEAPDTAFLHEIKVELAEHVEEFACLPAGSITWEGDASDLDAPPNFRLMTVVDAFHMTPHMRRIRLSGEALTRFASRRNLHCKLLIPPRGGTPEWPFLDQNGRFVWPSGPGRPAVRKYTIRAVDPDAGWLDIDFVLHDHAGPGSAWAATARPGDVIGLVGPGGRSVLPAARYLLAGDETALPSIARLLETLPAQSRGLALIEVADAGEEQAIDNRTAIDIRWLHRGAAPAGTSAVLANAVKALPQPDEVDDLFVWIACEFAAFKAIRVHLRREWGLAKEAHLITSYWRRGWLEDGAETLASASALVASIGRKVLGVAQARRKSIMGPSRAR